MARKTKQLMAVLLCLTVFVSSFGCGKKSKKKGTEDPKAKEFIESLPESGKLIEESDPFYTLSEFDIELPEKNERKVVSRFFGDVKILESGLFTLIEEEYEIDEALDEKWIAHITGEHPLSDEEAEEIEAMVSERYSSGLYIFDLDGQLKTMLPVNEQFDVESIFEGADGQAMVMYCSDGERKISEISSSGELLHTIRAKAPMTYTESCVAAPNGHFFISSYSGYVYIDSSGEAIWYESSEDMRGGVFRSQDKYYSLFFDFLTGEYSFREIDVETGKLKETSIPFQQEEFTDPELLIQSRNDIHINSSNGLSRLDVETDTTTIELPWNETDSYHSKIRSESLRVVSEDEYIFAVDMSRETTSMFEEDMGTVKIEHLKKAEKNPHAGKRVLSAVAVTTGNNYFYNSIVEYNRDPDKKARIVLTEFSSDLLYVLTKEHSEEQTLIEDQIYQEIKSGRGPDIMVNFGNDMPYERDDILLDLNSYLQQDDSINREDLFDNVLRAFEKDGKLYRIPVSFYMTGFVANGKYMDQKTNCTWADIETMFSSLPEDVQPLPEIRKQVLLNTLMATCMGDFIDYDKQEVHFDTEEFRKILEFANKYGENDKRNNSIVEPIYIDAGSFSANLDMVAMKDATVSSIEEYDYRAGAGRSVVFCGYPTSEGGGMSAEPILTFSVSKNCEYADEAWDFIRNFLGEESQHDMISYISGGFPISRDAFKGLFDESLAIAESERMLHIDGASNLVEEDYDRIVAVIENVSIEAKNDLDITAIVDEEAAAYFSGQKTADEVIKIIENRAKTVLQERA
ncbi:MAG: carbohydrate ABC transporter substrate-binding protein [Clostridiales bacterium]|nr:carbohydrate ABC transporter substrate-binding protein [Clostridiales bacterium]